jgi:hypothetical protein
MCRLVQLYGHLQMHPGVTHIAIFICPKRLYLQIGLAFANVAQHGTKIGQHNTTKQIQVCPITLQGPLSSENIHPSRGYYNRAFVFEPTN